MRRFMILASTFTFWGTHTPFHFSGRNLPHQDGIRLVIVVGDT